MNGCELTPEMIMKAREAYSYRTFKGKPLPLGFRYDILPLPDREGRRIIGPSTGNEYEAILVEGILKWRSI